MDAFLNQIRPKPSIQFPVRRELALAVFSLFLGGALGLLAKYLDRVPSLGTIGTSLGVWVLIATVLAAWSRSPEAAALRVFLFFAAMLTAYYTYSMLLFGGFPRHYFLSWGAIALLAPFAAYAAWYARGGGWAAAFCAALPIALLLAEGYRFYYTGDSAQILDVAAAVFLTFALGGKGIQRARILALALVVFLIFRQAHILSLIFGGL